MKLGHHGSSTFDASANLSCTSMTKFFNTYSCFININSDSWIQDSGATQHVTFDKQSFIQFKALPKSVMGNLPNS